MLAFDTCCAPRVTTDVCLARSVLRSLTRTKRSIMLCIPAPAHNIDSRAEDRCGGYGARRLCGGRLAVRELTLCGRNHGALKETLQCILLGFTFVFGNLVAGASLVCTRDAPPARNLVTNLLDYVGEGPFICGLRSVFPSSLMRANVARGNSLV